jgi:hypothetical protein
MGLLPFGSRVSTKAPCRGGQKVIIAPDGGDAWAPAKARLDETLICILT